MQQTGLGITVLIAVCVMVAGGCAPKSSSMGIANRAPSLPPSAGPNLERFDFSQDRLPSADTEVGRVDAYLSWLYAFETAKLQTNTQLAQRLKALDPVPVLNSSESTFGNDLGRNNPRSGEETLAALKEVTATTEKIATTFRSRPSAPPECESLANLYETALSKNLGALQRIVQQRAAIVQAVGKGTYDPNMSDRTANTMADNGAADMAEANKELRRLFQRYSNLKTAPFQFAF